MQLKQDTLIEGAEIVAYETLIEITKRINNNSSNIIPSEEIISALRQSLDEEKAMHKWCKENMPLAIDNLLPKIISAISK